MQTSFRTVNSASSKGLNSVLLLKNNPLPLRSHAYTLDKQPHSQPPAGPRVNAFARLDHHLQHACRARTVRHHHQRHPARHAHAHPPGSAFAWILITTLLPYFGFILYLLFGDVRSVNSEPRVFASISRTLRSSRARSSLLRGRCRATSPDTARSYIWRPAWGTFP